MRDDEAPIRLNDDEVRTAIRTRLRDGLPCNAPTLREAVGGGGTERLVRLLREVRAESPDASRIQINSSTAIAETLPPELEKRFEALRFDMLATVVRVREEERAAAAAAAEHAARATQMRLDRVSDDEATATNNALELAKCLDLALARMRELEVENTALVKRGTDAEVLRQHEAANYQARWTALDTAYHALLARVIPPKMPRARATATNARNRQSRKV
jgi:hypothetical protein